jgi:hypothetical protein
MHSVAIRGVGMLTVILSVIMLNAVMQSVFLHSVVMVSVIKLNVVMQCSYAKCYVQCCLSVSAPFFQVVITFYTIIQLLIRQPIYLNGD